MKKILIILLLLTSITYITGCNHRHRHKVFASVGNVTTLTIGIPITDHIDGAGDTDKYTVLLEKDKIYLFRTFNLSSDIDTVLLLFDSNGVLLAENDNESESSLASALQYQIIKNGIYCIVVRHKSTEANSGMYDLIVEFVSDVPAGDDDDDDECDGHHHSHTNTIGQGHKCDD